MSTTVNITIKNLPEIKRAFDIAPFEMTKQLNLAIRKSVFNIQRQAVQYAPVDSGRLWKSISSKFGNLKGEVGSGAATGEAVNYDIYVQLGTRYQDAQPYLFSAVADSERDVNKYMEEAVQNTLDKIAGMV